MMVENERFGGKKREKGGKQDRRINIRTAIWSHEGMEGSHFLLPFSESVERGSEKRFSE